MRQLASIDIAILAVNSATLVVLAGTFYVVIQAYLLEREQKSITRINKITRFLHENEEWGISKSGSGIFRPRRKLSSYVMKSKWETTATLYTKKQISEPAIIYSWKPDLTQTAMETINVVYAVSDKKEEIENKIKKKLDNNKIYQSISVQLSDKIWVRLDIIRK